jgi:hypothetical protein
MIALGSSNK